MVCWENRLGEWEVREDKTGLLPRRNAIGPALAESARNKLSRDWLRAHLGRNARGLEITA